MTPLRFLAFTLIFLLELAVPVAVGYYGFALDAGWPVRLLVGLGGPAVMIGLWALYGSPKARYSTYGAGRLAFETAWFGTAALALIGSGHSVLAAVFVVLLLLSKLAVAGRPHPASTG